MHTLYSFKNFYLQKKLDSVKIITENAILLQSLIFLENSLADSQISEQVWSVNATKG